MSDPAVTERVERVAAAFEGLTARRPSGVWSAPGRVNLIGEHTDYNDGFVLPIAIDRCAVAAVSLRDDGRARCRSLQERDVADTALTDVRPGAVDGWSAYVVGVAWALREAGLEIPGFDLVVDSDVPSGGGLSSSAALETVTALALADLTGADVDRTALALACRRAENDVVGAPTGVMDQMAALHGRAGHAVFLDCRSLEVEHVPLDLEAGDLALVVVDTGVTHAHADGGYAARRRACEEAAAALGVDSLRDVSLDQVESALDGELLRRARHVVTENRRVLDTVRMLREGGPRRIGHLLDASHVSMRDDFEISCDEVEVAVTAASRAGALGARMTGGGFGGCVVALCGEAGAVTEAIVTEYRSRGYARPAVFDVHPSPGATRLI